ncbi:NACHT domain-containing protein [Sphingobacterium yanglingense]|uniref:NACHT domain-containing protein n=1 Tax=Sphingobacterium yanglingense TaxID=1437280 RepID=A0A4R6WG06_9SPHI|nr:hypothetical protein [Sphingobacterium yanglingense]TDQ79080.1 hypothetical protein CLV99_0512 [Sphingobacterium yanglingense]
MQKKGLDFERTTLEFLSKIFKELGYTVTRKRNQKSGTQDGYDILLEIVTGKYKSHTIYAECKDYSSNLSYAQAIEKIPHIVSTHQRIDLLLFLSPYEDFSNPNEPAKLGRFYDKLAPECPVQFLTPEYHIKDYLNLYPDLFEKVYKESPYPISVEERKELLDQFDKVIFSDKNLQKVVIEDSDRELYIGSIDLVSNYIERSFRSNPIPGIYGWNNSTTVEFDTIMMDCELGIVLLGNPGSGKTSEIKHRAISLWHNRGENEIIPFYRSLKNFNSSSTIESILPTQYRQISFLVIILDGLDEVYDITDFSNKLRSFIEEYKKERLKTTLKFIISCRTSIYNKIVKDLEGFTTAYLNPIAEGQALRYLKDKFDIDFVRANHGIDFWKHRDLLDTPFYLELIGNNYLKTGRLEMSRSKLIRQYIKHRLEHDDKDKFRNDIDRSTLHLQEAKTLALAMETMQVTSIDESRTRAFINDTSNLAKNPFIEQSSDKQWSFELKSIQEYLVADMLSKMAFEELINIIKVNSNVNKVHPSWHNVITLLLAIEFEERETYDKLVSWLIKHNIELIFQADVELVSDEIRNDTLQTYFHSYCIKKTLWIDNEGSVGKFGDTITNIEYLIDKALNKTLNLRTRLSAIVLLEQMSLATENSSKRVKELLVQVMEEFQANQNDLFNIMRRTLSLVKKLKEETKTEIISVVTEFVSEYDYREFVQTAIRLINEYNFNTFKKFVFLIFKKSICEIRWSYRSKYGSVFSTKTMIFDLFCQIDAPKTLISILDFISKRLTNHRLREANVERFIQYCSSKLQSANDKDKRKLVEIVFNIIKTKKIYHLEELLLASLVKDSAIEDELFDRLLALETESNTNIYFLEDILNQKHYITISSAYKSGALPASFLIQLRNRLQYNNLNEAIRLQNYIEENTSFVYTDRIEDSKVEEKRLFNQNSYQREFDVKFNLPLLVEQMKNIFRFYEATELSFEDVDCFWDKYYNDFDLQKKISEYAKRLLWEILKEDYPNDEKLSINDLEESVLKHELDRIEDIYQNLPKTDEPFLNISETQKSYLKEWVFNNKITVEKYLDSPREDISENDSRTLTLFLNLLRYFKPAGFEDIFLLQLVDFIKYSYFDFGFIDEMLDTDIVSLKVLKELRLSTQPLVRITFLSYLKSKNISFNLKLFGLEEEIKNAVLDKNYDYARKIIELFYIDNVSFLKSIVNLYKTKEEDYYFLPFIITRLFELNEQDFIASFVTDNYEELVNKAILAESLAIRYLIKSNQTLGFEKISTIIKNITNNAGDTYYDLEYKLYSNPASIETLLDIAEYCLSLDDLDKIFNAWFKPINMVSEALVNIGDKNGLEISEKILNGLEAIIPYDDAKKNNTFYHEGLKNSIRNVIYKHMSKPFTFNQARNFAKDNDFIFY